MTVSEYEGRFRISSPSLHETFVAMQGSGPRRRRRQRFWAAVALAGGIMAANGWGSIMLSASNTADIGRGAPTRSPRAR